MGKSTDISLKAVRTGTQRIDYRTPIKFGGRVVRDVVILDVEVDVVTRDGRVATGLGSMTLGNAWAWPSASVESSQTLLAVQRLGESFSLGAADLDLCGHPLELTHALAGRLELAAAATCQDLGITEPMPALARLLAASPLEAAVHDAYGKAHQANAYNLLGAEFVNADLSYYLTDEFAGEYLDRYTTRAPKPSMPLYHLVGALDPLDSSELGEPVGDGLPETLGDWILADGLTHLKIKLAGDDLEWDVDRVVAVERVAAAAQAQRGCTRWAYSLDFNEKCDSVEYVLEFLNRLRQASPPGWDRVQYIEQPTHRDLRANPANRMHAAAAIKPVVIDESLVDLDSLLLAREQGYSGVALKACKGHSEALLMGAAAQKFGMFLCVQDLTCVGASFLHSASLAARLPTVAAIEGNGRQYCPAGNEPWRTRFPGMFDIHDGTVNTSQLDGPGLGGW